MSRIKIVPSMALDAICFINQYNCLDSSSNLLEAQMNFIEEIEILTDGKLKNGSLSMSTLCGILTVYAENADFENYTFDDLAEIFKNPEDMRNVVKSKITNEFQASYTYPALDKFVDEWAEIYLNYINILKETGFDKLWESALLPTIQDEIARKDEIYKSLDIDGAIEDIQKLKQCESLSDIKIYVSFMSFPVAFKLHGNNFVDCIQGNRGAGIICHELMHGFSNKELEKLYLDYIYSIKYLTEQHDRLINEQHSGNEEEFVMAAEFYLRMKHNGEDKKELFRSARNAYNGCMPTSVFLFDLLSKESETPNDYAQWLTDVFKNKKLPKKAIERNLDIVCPKKPYEEFNDNLFGSFRRVIAKMNETAARKDFDTETKIKNLTKQIFEETDKKSVYFGQEYQPLPNALKIKIMQAGNLYINIAEYKDRATALCDGINDAGGNIGAEAEKVNGKLRALHNVNISCLGKTPVTLSATFIKDKYRISFTARCPEYVNRNLDYPSTLKELDDLIRSGLKEIGENIIPISEFLVNYSKEVLAAQNQIEDIIMQL